MTEISLGCVWDCLSPGRTRGWFALHQDVALFGAAESEWPSHGDTLVSRLGGFSRGSLGFSPAKD